MSIIDIDGSYGEGGGQVLRSALSLSLVTGTPFRITKIRAGRGRPGLLRQHVTCVRAACGISGATCEGAEPSSQSLAFHPKKKGARAGEYSFAVGSAGSTSLVLATILMPLLLAEGESVVRLTGGTHNPSAPPFEFLAEVLFPRLRELGFRVDAKLERAGFFPAGGGELTVRLGSARTADLVRAEWLTRGDVTLSAKVIVANLGQGVAGRELITLADALQIPRKEIVIADVASSGPGNAVIARATSLARVEELVTSFGERGKSAESVAESAARELSRYVESGAPVGEHLGDQLLLPLAFAAGGAFRCHAKSMHLTTNAWVLSRFLGDVVTFTDLGAEGTRVDVRNAAP